MDRFGTRSSASASFLPRSTFRTVVQQLEVTYINWIQGVSASEFLKLGNAGAISVEGVEPEPEVQGWVMRDLVESEGTRVAALQVLCRQAFRPSLPKPGLATSWY